jgi:hypothetical protein
MTRRLGEHSAPHDESVSKIFPKDWICVDPFELESSLPFPHEHLAFSHPTHGTTVLVHKFILAVSM